MKPTTDDHMLDALFTDIATTGLETADTASTPLTAITQHFTNIVQHSLLTKRRKSQVQSPTVATIHKNSEQFEARQLLSALSPANIQTLQNHTFTEPELAALTTIYTTHNTFTTSAAQTDLLNAPALQEYWNTLSPTAETELVNTTTHATLPAGSGPNAFYQSRNTPTATQQGTRIDGLSGVYAAINIPVIAHNEITFQFTQEPDANNAFGQVVYLHTNNFAIAITIHRAGTQWNNSQVRFLRMASDFSTSYSDTNTMSPFQFSGPLKIKLTLKKDGTITGTATSTTNQVFTFSGQMPAWQQASAVTLTTTGGNGGYNNFSITADPTTLSQAQLKADLTTYLQSPSATQYLQNLHTKVIEALVLAPTNLTLDQLYALATIQKTHGSLTTPAAQIAISTHPQLQSIFLTQPLEKVNDVFFSTTRDSALPIGSSANAFFAARYHQTATQQGTRIDGPNGSLAAITMPVTVTDEIRFEYIQEPGTNNQFGHVVYVHTKDFVIALSLDRASNQWNNSKFRMLRMASDFSTSYSDTTIMSPFQFSGPMKIAIILKNDGTISGTATTTSNQVFTFSGKTPTWSQGSAVTLTTTGSNGGYNNFSISTLKTPPPSPATPQTTQA